MPAFVTYFRVSTERQGQSGLGLEAQREAVDRFVAQNGGEILSTFVEVESDKRSDRPELQRALTECRRRKATLLIAKLDRLARNVAFISGLMETSVEFVAVDNPHANRLMLHLLAAFAEHEREMIAARTKAALAAAKARGTVLGKNGRALARRHQADAHARARAIKPIIESIRSAGIHTLQGIADALNAQAIPAPAGGNWHATSIRRLLHRLETLAKCNGLVR